MNSKFEIPSEIKNIISEGVISEINIGCSDSEVFKIVKTNQIIFLKIAKEGLLTNEYEKLKWLSGKTKVPKIVTYLIFQNTEYLITESLNGEMVCSDYYLKNPDQGIPIIVESFNELYSINISTCPFNVSLNYKLSLAKSNIDNGLINIDDVSSQALQKYGSLIGIYNYLYDNKYEEELCFSHGDLSLPNIFAENGKFSGFIDVGDCGIADKWFDIALVTRSIIRNYGEEFLETFYEGINVIPDKHKIDYYLLLMELYL
ncbi:MAG: aminoglycoside 3'-phosphotransferase [Bacilli bacterium]|nr:aminoglycoside 3'-phosphotransferase [Bacilli bacterium]